MLQIWNWKVGAQNGEGWKWTTGRATAQKNANVPHKKSRRRRRTRRTRRRTRRMRRRRKRRKEEAIRSTFYGIMQDKMLRG